MARRLYKNVCAKDTHKFPLTESRADDKSFIVKRKLLEEKFFMIKEVGKQNGATINDMLVAAYFYSLYELAGYGNETAEIKAEIIKNWYQNNTDAKENQKVGTILY